MAYARQGVLHRQAATHWVLAGANHAALPRAPIPSLVRDPIPGATLSAAQVRGAPQRDTSGQRRQYAQHLARLEKILLG